MNGRLFLHALKKSGRTMLGESYFTPPFKVADITSDKKAGPLEMVIMSSSPGILDGDEYEIRIRVGEEARLKLSTQSFQRLFQMKNGARQLTEVHLEPGSSMVYLPHPVVPHEASVFKSVNIIKMDTGSELVWGEVITCGRALNGEKFKYSIFESLTEVHREERLIMKENIRMIPSVGNIGGMGMLESFTHQASLICFREEKISPAIEQVNLLLMEFKDIEYGISATRTNGFVLRILGNAAYQLHQILQNIAELL